MLQFVCEDCGETVVKKSRVGRPLNGKKCRLCYDSDRKRSERIRKKLAAPAKNCKHCGSPIPKDCSRSGYCSSSCADIADMERKEKYNQAVAEERKTARNCAWCAAEFIVKSSLSNSKYCCEEHRQHAWNEVKRAKLKLKGISRVPPAAVGYSVLQRDKWTCQACGIRTPESLRGLSQPNSPEVDHIIPLSRGGSHDESNLQCLCRQCNGSKGARLPGEWVPDNDNRECREVAA